jgi:hypothetical protein
VLDHVVDARGERRDVVGLHGREHPHAQLVAAELAVRERVEHPGLPQVPHDLVGVDRVVQVDGPDHGGPLGGLGDERRRPLAGLGPAVQQLGRALAAGDGPVETALVEQPLDLVGQHDEGRDGGRVQRLVLAGVVRRRGERQELRHPAVAAGRLDLRGALERGG